MSDPGDPDAPTTVAVVEMDAMDLEEWEQDQHTPAAPEEHLAALVKQTRSAPATAESAPAPAVAPRKLASIARAPAGTPPATVTPAAVSPGAATPSPAMRVPTPAPLTRGSTPAPGTRTPTPAVVARVPTVARIPSVAQIARVPTPASVTPAPMPAAETRTPTPAVRAREPTPAPEPRAPLPAPEPRAPLPAPRTREPTPAPIVTARAAAAAIAGPAPPPIAAPVSSAAGSAPAAAPPAMTAPAPGLFGAPVSAPVAPRPTVDAAPGHSVAPVSRSGAVQMPLGDAASPSISSATPSQMPLGSRDHGSVELGARPRSPRKLVLAASLIGGVLLVVVLVLAVGRGGTNEPPAEPAVLVTAPAVVPHEVSPPAPAAAPSPPSPAPQAAPVAPAPAAAPAAAVPPTAPAQPPRVAGKRVVLEYDGAKKPVAPAAPAGAGDDAAVGKARTAYASGNQLLFAGDPDGAIREYRQSLAFYPGYVAGYRGLGLAYAQQGDKAKASQAFRTYLNLVPAAKDAPLIKRRLSMLSH
jgi:hypothetical protein